MHTLTNTFLYPVLQIKHLYLDKNTSIAVTSTVTEHSKLKQWERLQNVAQTSRDAYAAIPSIFTWNKVINELK